MRKILKKCNSKQILFLTVDRQLSHPSQTFGKTSWMNFLKTERIVLD